MQEHRTPVTDTFTLMTYDPGRPCKAATENGSDDRTATLMKHAELAAEDGNRRKR